MIPQTSLQGLIAFCTLGVADSMQPTPVWRCVKSEGGVYQDAGIAARAQDPLQTCGFPADSCCDMWWFMCWDASLWCVLGKFMMAVVLVVATLQVLCTIYGYPNTLSSDSAVKDPEDCWPFHAEVPAHPEMQDVVQCLSLSVGEVEGLVAQSESRTDLCKTSGTFTRPDELGVFAEKCSTKYWHVIQHDFEILREHHWCKMMLMKIM